jgi:hypothetical protein
MRTKAIIEFEVDVDYCVQCEKCKVWHSTEYTHTCKLKLIEECTSPKES